MGLDPPSPSSPLLSVPQHQDSARPAARTCGCSLPAATAAASAIPLTATGVELPAPPLLPRPSWPLPVAAPAGDRARGPQRARLVVAGGEARCRGCGDVCGPAAKPGSTRRDPRRPAIWIRGALEHESSSGLSEVQRRDRHLGGHIDRDGERPPGGSCAIIRRRTRDPSAARPQGRRRHRGGRSTVGVRFTASRRRSPTAVGGWKLKCGLTAAVPDS